MLFEALPSAMDDSDKWWEKSQVNSCSQHDDDDDDDGEIFLYFTSLQSLWETLFTIYNSFFLMQSKELINIHLSGIFDSPMIEW